MTIAIGVVAALIAAVLTVLVLAAMRPDEFALQRSTTIAAPAEKIFPLIEDLRAQATWSPWEKDPSMKKSYSGADRGKGAVYEWQGNSQVGRGRLEVVETAPPSKVVLKLDMLAPIEGHNVVEFTLRPAGAGTEVSWAMRGRQAFIIKVFGLFCSSDKMIGREFEKGLANLKALVEKPA